MKAGSLVLPRKGFRGKLAVAAVAATAAPTNIKAEAISTIVLAKVTKSHFPSTVVVCRLYCESMQLPAFSIYYILCLRECL